jgi:hypothetical protein
MATLFAFAQAPHAASLDITQTHDVGIWTYDTRVLAVLALPFLATILVLSVYWKVQSNEVVIGYDPLEIARRADEVLVLSLGAMESEGKDLRPMNSGGAYSALEARPPSREAGDWASLADNIAEIPPPRRSRSTGTDERSDGVVSSPSAETSMAAARPPEAWFRSKCTRLSGREWMSNAVRVRL